MLASEIITKGEDLFLPCFDPVVTKVRGYRRFLVGLDIAQSIDQNAFAIIEDVREPAWGEYAQFLKPRTRTIVRAERIPQMDYTRLAQVVKNLMADPALVGRAHLVVDAGGPGRSFCDLLNAKGVQHTRMQIVGGDNENETKERATTFWKMRQCFFFNCHAILPSWRTVRRNLALRKTLPLPRTQQPNDIVCCVSQ